MKTLVLDLNWSLNRSLKFTDRHHLWGGKSIKKGTGPRDIADDYGLYVYLEHGFHLYEVEPNKKSYTKQFCIYLNIDYITINKLIKQKPRKYWDECDNKYMEMVRDHLKRMRSEE